jgi:hypothetical protein
MTLRHFLDSAYTLLVEEYQRLGIPLLTALDHAAKWSAGGKREEAGDPAEAAIARQNEQSLKELEKLMAST